MIHICFGKIWFLYPIYTLSKQEKAAKYDKTEPRIWPLNCWFLNTYDRIIKFKINTKNMYIIGALYKQDQIIFQ